MQKSFIAIALALTLTSAFASYAATNYVTSPVTVAQDSDTNYTSQPNPIPFTSPLSLASITTGNLYLVSGNLTLNANTTINNWNIFYRQLNNKNLAGTQNNTASIVAPSSIFYLNNYAFGLVVDTTSGASNLWVSQIPLTSGTTVPGRLQLSNNTDNAYSVVPLGTVQIGNTIYVAYSTSTLTSSITVNINSFTIGATAPGTPINVSTTLDAGTFSFTWGEALGTSQLFAVWSESGILKDALIVLSNRTVGATTVVPGYIKGNQGSCSAFATDKTLYGELCYANDPNITGNIIYWVRTTANGTFIQVASYPSSTSTFSSLVPYGPYIAVFFQSVGATNGTNFAYEIWNLGTFNATQPRKLYLTITTNNSTQIPFRVPSGGYYTLLYNALTFTNGTINGSISSIQVGLLLGSSYLASVLGFLLTIVASLLLF